MDIRLHDAHASADERSAVDAMLGPPRSAWDGGERGSARDAHSAHGGREQRERRQFLLPALQSLQSRIGWVSEGGLNYVCERLGVPPAEAWSVATFYALIATSPRPRRVVHVCDDIACRARGAKGLCERLTREVGPALAHAPEGDTLHHHPEHAAWAHSPCLGLCDAAPAALLTEAGATPIERLAGHVTVESVRAMLDQGVAAAQAQNTAAVNGGADQTTTTTVSAAHAGADPAAHAGADPAAHAGVGSTAAEDAAAHPPLPQRGDPALVLLKRIGTVDPTSLDAYRAASGYRALARALEAGAETVIREVELAKLVGRGGAAFPAHRKWAAVRAQAATPRYLVCNADESEPGTFKDRVLLCGDPFAVVEAMTIAAFAAGCAKGYLYVRAEYPLAHERMHGAIAAASAAGLLGENILGTGFSFDIEIRRGSGAYICGEETALFESIEGRRGEPRVKPPFPVESGLFGKPTVVNNVETLVNVLPIVLDGGTAFARIGTAQSTGTRLFCLSGNVRTPGIYEVPLGTTLRALIELAGGIEPGRTLQAVLLGGAAGTFLRADEIDLALTLEDARAANATLGSGVVMVFDDSADLRDVLLRIASFFRDESCGQCVPCRVGTVRQEEALDRLIRAAARGSAASELRLIDDVGAGMRDGSICGLGQTAYAAVESAIKRLRLFGDTSERTLAPAHAPPAPNRAAASGRIEIQIDGRTVAVRPGATILDACRSVDLDIPTLCFLETLAPASACRLCVVEVEGSRVLAPSCSRAAEAGMVVHTASDRVRHSRRMVLEMLASSVDLSTAPEMQRLVTEYGCEVERYGPMAAGRPHHAHAGHHEAPDAACAASVRQPVKIDNDLYVRDLSKCVLCYKCVEACGEDHQNTFAIAVAGRGFDARIATEFDVPLGDSACVYCGNCIAVCPTGALMAKTEYDMRQAGSWDESRQTATDTICPYCGVGCTLRLHVQDGRIVKATSPLDQPITLGNLCIKGRFGWRFVQPETKA